jgi:putative ABC transport system permease protein
MTVASLALAVTLVGTAMGFEATIDRLSRDSGLRAQPFDVRVDTAELSTAEVDRILASRRDIAAVARIHEVPMTASDGAAEIHVRIVDGPVARFPYAIPDGRAARAPGEVTLGRGALDALHARIGDRITLRAAGRQVPLHVVGRHVEPDDEGRGAVAPRAGLPAAVVDVDESPYWGVQVRRGADAAAVAASLRRDTHGRLDAERPVESLRREAADMRPVVYGTGGLLVLIAFVNLLTTLLLAVRERERDFAILASTGATPRQVLATVVAGGSSLALPAALVGLPFGAAMFFFMIGVTDPADGPDVRALPAWWWYPLVVPAALGLTALVSTLAARQAARVQPAVALRAE